MKKLLYTLLVLTLVFSQRVKPQEISAKDLKKTKWFCNNTDNLFYKSDEIKLIQYSNISKKEKDYTSYKESEYYDDLESIEIQFNRRCSLNFNNKYYNTGSISLKKWKVKGSKLLIFDENEKIEFIFKIESLNYIEFKINEVSYYTKELILTKIKRIIKR